MFVRIGLPQQGACNWFSVLRAKRRVEDVICFGHFISERTARDICPCLGCKDQIDPEPSKLPVLFLVCVSCVLFSGNLYIYYLEFMKLIYLVPCSHKIQQR